MGKVAEGNMLLQTPGPYCDLPKMHTSFTCKCNQQNHFSLFGDVLDWGGSHYFLLMALRQIAMSPLEISRTSYERWRVGEHLSEGLKCMHLLKGSSVKKLLGI